jgi:hypothetical protein
MLSSGHEMLQTMWSQSGVSLDRWPVPLQDMRVSVHMDDRLGRQSTFCGDEASAAGTVHSCGSGVPATTHRRSHERALLSVDPCLFCACRGTAGIVRGSHRVRRDHDRLGPAGKARLGSRRHGHRVGDPAAQRSGEGVCRSRPERESDRRPGSGATPAGQSVLHR